jgi:hypothetical protein
MNPVLEAQFNAAFEEGPPSAEWLSYLEEFFRRRQEETRPMADLIREAKEESLRRNAPRTRVDDYLEAEDDWRKTMANTYEFFTDTHEALYFRVREALRKLKEGGGIPGLRLKLSPPRKQPDGPVAWIISIHFDASGSEAWPGHLALYGMRESGRVEVRLEPRPQPGGRAALNPSLTTLVRPLEAKFKGAFEVIVDEELKGPESPAQRRRREAAEAAAKAEAELDELMDIFGGEE